MKETKRLIIVFVILPFSALLLLYGLKQLDAFQRAASNARVMQQIEADLPYYRSCF